MTNTMIAALVIMCLAGMMTAGMLWSRRMMFGFPCAIAWAVAGGFAYQLYTATWDMWYILMFSCFGMAIFSMLGMYALRKKDLTGPDADKGQFIDEGSRQPSTRGYRYDGGGHKTQYLDDEGEYGVEGGFMDIDRLGMNDMSDPAWDRRQAQKRRDKVAEIRDRMHSRAEERRKGINWGNPQ